MDDIKRPRQTRVGGAPYARRDYIRYAPESRQPVFRAQSPEASTRQPIEQPEQASGFHPFNLTRLSAELQKLKRGHPVAVRLGWGFLAFLMLGTIFFDLFNILQMEASYKINAQAESLVGKANPALAKSLTYDSKAATFEYNKDYQLNKEVGGQGPGPKFSASFPKNVDKGVVITDPHSETSMTVKPEFAVAEPVKDQNRLVYPLKGRDSQKIYTLMATGFKEDLVLNSYQGDNLSFSYQLQLAEGTEARLEKNGSVGIYGVNPTLLGDVATGNEKDKKLLQQARQNGEKNKLLFSLPAPYVRELNKKASQVNAWYTLEGKTLTAHAKGLKQASYPLSIDPTIYVESASKLMRGNNETNVDFDPSQELLQKSQLSGARFDTWSTSGLALPAQRFDAGTAVYGGYIYEVGGRLGSSNVSTVYWSKINSSTKLLEAPNPGAGACASWCTSTDYDLPSPRAAFKLVAYNGFLYVLGGRDPSCTTGNGTGNGAFCDTVYIAKLGANGEPAKWHPTDTNKNNWAYWYRDTDLSSERTYAATVAYNNRMYFLGGLTNTPSTNTVLDTSQYADIKPNGTIGSWSTTTALPATLYGTEAHAYNDRMYIVGGYNSSGGGVLEDEVGHIKINSDGTFASSGWYNNNQFTNGRTGWGGNFSVILGGYLYVIGGCTAATTTAVLDECTASGITNGGTMQLASINADGTISNWGTINGVTNAKIGYGLLAWQGALYGVGGCTVQANGGDCSTTITTVNYGIVNDDGDASTVATSVSSGTSPCSGGDPYNCNLPGTANIGNMLNITAIMNGYLYIIGGCTNNGCTTTIANVAYTEIGSDGHLSLPSTCSGNTTVSAYCIDSTNVLTGGVAAAGVSVFNGRIYVVGGVTGSALKNTVYRVSVNNDGSMGTWSSQSMSGGGSLGITSVSYTYSYARANPSSAGTNPGNLYIFGGCSGNGGGAGCTSGANISTVYKCNIAASDGSLNGCTTTGQLAISQVTGSSGAGLALHSGTVYANYIYLVGGVAPGLTDLSTVRYAKFDNSNNVVAASGSTWIESANETSVGRRRAASFGYNGYLYVVGGYDGSGGGVLSDIQFAKIDVSDGDIEAFDTSAVTINQRWGLSVPVSSSYAYVIGGCTTGAAPGSCTVRTDTVQTFQIYNNESGVPASFTSSSNNFTVSTDRWGASAAVLNGYLYAAGGCISATDCTSAAVNVQKAALDPTTGEIGTWSATGALPAVRAWGELETVGGYLYWLGGQGNTSTNEFADIYYAQPDGSGNISAWSDATGDIGDTASQASQARTKFSATVWNDRIYVVGGLDTNAAVTNTVYISPQLSSGGDIAADSWTSDADTFSVARMGAAVTAYANNLYLIGGFDGTNYLNDVQYTQINSDGTIDAWTFTTSLPGPVSQGEAFAANGYLYLVGGRSAASTCVPNTLVSPISANTTILTGNNPTGIGEWFETNVRYSGDRYGAAVAYDQGKLYMLGGGCTAPLSTNRHYYASLKSQPAVARYSLMIDTDSDVFPTKWLANGLDNSTGAAWYMRYRSMNDIDGDTTDCVVDMTTWGQETNFGKITLGVPQTYTPKDSSGNTTNCARYFFLAVNIDSSQAFGYPEDVSRGPTIYDLSLFFTSDPGKRLLHGKTFTGGVQQPLDTPFP